MKKVKLAEAIKAMGYTIEKKSKGYNFRSIFARDEAGQLWYFHIEDLRDSEPMIYRRTAESITDYRGGQNRFDVEEKAEQLGLIIYEPRTAGDYNKM